MELPSEALVELTLRIERTTEYKESDLEDLEKLTASLLPKVTLEDLFPLKEITSCTLKLLQCIANNKAGNGEHFNDARMRLVDIMCKCLQKQSEIPTLNAIHVIHVFQHIRACGDKNLQVRTALLQSCFQTFLSYASIEHGIDTAKEAIECFNHLLQGTTRELRNMLREDNKRYIKRLLNFLMVCGDYSVQECVMETLTRLAPQNMRNELAHIWFKDFPSEAKNAFQKFGQIYFQIEVQLFLNSVNMNFDTNVHPFVCQTILYKNHEMFKPEFQERLYVNFSLGSKLISFSALRKNSPVDDDENPLQNVDILVPNIKEAALIPTKSHSMKVLTVFLHRPSFRFVKRYDTSLHADVVMVLKDVNVDILKKMMGKKLEYDTSKISDFIVHISQEALSNRAVRSSVNLQITELTSYEKDATAYMDDDEEDDPWEKESVVSRKSESRYLSREPSFQEESKLDKRPQTPMKIPQSRVENSPGKSTYLNYMALAESDDKDDLSTVEKRTIERTATPAAGVKSKGMPENETNVLVQECRVTPISWKMKATEGNFNREKIRNGTPIVENATKKHFSTPSLPKGLSDECVKGVNGYSQENITIQKTPASKVKPRRISTPALKATEKIPDFEDVTRNEKQALKRRSMPEGSCSRKERSAHGQPSGDISRKTSDKTLDDAHHHSPESDLEDIALADRMTQKIEPMKRKTRQPKKGAKTCVSKAKKPAKQPRKRKANVTKTSNLSKYPKLDITVRTHYSSSLASPAGLHNSDKFEPPPSNMHVNTNQCSKVETRRKRRLFSVKHDGDDKQRSLQVEEAFETNEHQKSNIQLPHEAYIQLNNNHYQNLRTYGANKKPVFPKYMQSVLNSRDSVFDELLNSTYQQETPRSSKPVQHVTPKMAKMPRLFDEFSLSGEIGESEHADNPFLMTSEPLKRLKPRKNQAQKQNDSKASAIKVGQRRSARASKSTTLGVTKLPIESADDQSTMKTTKENNLVVEARNEKRGGAVSKKVAGSEHMKRGEDSSTHTIKELKTNIAQQTIEPTNPVEHGKMDKESVKRVSLKKFKHSASGLVEEILPSCDLLEFFGFEYPASNSSKPNDSLIHKESTCTKKKFGTRHSDCMVVDAVEYKRPDVVGSEMYNFKELFCTDDEDTQSAIQKTAALQEQSSIDNYQEESKAMSPLEKFGWSRKNQELIDVLKKKLSAVQTDSLACFLDGMTSEETAQALDSSKRKKRLSSRLSHLFAAFNREETRAKAQLRQQIVRKIVSEIRKAIKEEKQDLEVVTNRIEIIKDLHIALDYATTPKPKAKNRIPTIIELGEDLVDVDSSHMDDSNLIAEQERIIAEETRGVASGIHACFRRVVSKAWGYFFSK